jgi:predicted transcriptional regulator YdeE
MEPTLTTLAEAKVIGVELRTSNAREANPATAQIPGLWRRFLEENLMVKIPSRKEAGVILGVYTNYESDHTGMYSLVLSAEVASLGSVPQGLVGLTIPAARYLVFPARGPIPDAIVHTWQKVWSYFSSSSEYQRAYTVDFERHEWNADAQKPEVDIHIAVK